MRPDSKAAAALVQSIYEGVLSAEFERAVVEDFKVAFQSAGTLLVNFDVGGLIHSASKTLHTTFPISDQVRRDGEEYWNKINPVLPRAAPNFRLGGVMSNADVISVRDYRESEFHYDWVRPQFGYLHELGTVVEERDGFSSMLMVCRSAEEGCFNSADRTLLGVLSPHLQRAFALRKHVERLGHTVNQLAEALDSGGLIGINRQGSVCYQRGRLLALLLADGWMSIMRDQIFTRDPLARERIMRGLRPLLEGRLSQSVLLPFQVATQPLMIELLPAPPRVVSDAIPDAVVWILLRGSDSLEKALRLDRVARRYGLTARESEVAASLIEGVGVRAIAANLGVTYNTARAHVKSILHKAGVNRQSALAGLVNSEPDA